MAKHANKANTASLLIRAGLAIVFLYAAIASLTHPQDWAAFLPGIITKLAPATSWLKVFAIYELVLAGFLIGGKYVRYVGMVCAVTFAGIIASQPSLFSVTFRDVALIFASLALVFIDD